MGFQWVMPVGFQWVMPVGIQWVDWETWVSVVVVVAVTKELPTWCLRLRAEMVLVGLRWGELVVFPTVLVALRARAAECHRPAG